MLDLDSFMDTVRRQRPAPPEPQLRQTIQVDPIEIPPPAFEAEGVFDDKTVTIGLASFPARVDHLRHCVDSLYGQCDYLCVYLNNYSEVPYFLQRPKILPYLGTNYRDLNANGKIFFVDWAKDGYYFTADDDFVYPSNYISHMKSRIETYGRRCAATVHGSIFPESFGWYYERTAMYQYQGPLAADRFVHLPGTGSFGFHKSTFKAEVVNFLPRVMVDLSFAILCKRQRVPIVSVMRPSMWMMNTERSGLFQQFSKVITHHTTYAVKEAPWSFQEYSGYVEPIMAAAFGGMNDKALGDQGVDVDFVAAMRKGHSPNSWGDTMTSMRRRVDAMSWELR